MKPLVAKAGACLLGAIFSAPLSAQQLPSYYPADYNKIVEASKAESSVLVYSIMSAQNWKPVLETFNKKYPWIKVETLDLSNEIWSRYYSERAAGARTADLIITLGVSQWTEFIDKNEALVYESPESKHVPQWSKPFPGMYSVSADPVMIIWNSKLLPGKKFNSMAQVAELAADPKMQGKLTTYDGASGGMTLTFPWVWSQYHKEKGWALLDKVGPATKPERSGGTMLSKVVTGEYALAYLTSAITVLPKLNDPGIKNVIEWSFITDGQPIYARAMAISKGAKSPNSAKLLLDHTISHEGQVGWGKGGLTPLRDDVRDDEVPYYTYKRIEREVGGPSKIQVLQYDPKAGAESDAYVKRWKEAYKRP